MCLSHKPQKNEVPNQSIPNQSTQVRLNKSSADPTPILESIGWTKVQRETLKNLSNIE